MKMLIGLLIGIVLAITDAFLLRYGMRKAIKAREHASAILSGLFALRYFLLIAVLATILLIGKDYINAVGVILPMILQKVILTILSLFEKN